MLTSPSYTCSGPSSGSRSPSNFIKAPSPQHTPLVASDVKSSGGHPIISPRQTCVAVCIPTHRASSQAQLKIEFLTIVPISTPQSYPFRSPAPLPSHVRQESKNISLRFHHARTFKNISTLTPSISPRAFSPALFPQHPGTSQSLCSSLAILSPAVSSSIPKAPLGKVGLGLLPALTDAFGKAWECSHPPPIF